MRPFSIELAPSFRPMPVRHVLMDWDGTTALSRSGWDTVMTDIYVENLPRLADETNAAHREFSRAELMHLNGRPSIHQMERLAALVKARGGAPRQAADYQAEFQRRLGRMVHARLERIRRGVDEPGALLVAGVTELLAHLRARGIPVTLASGTPILQLREEVELLGLTDFFDGGIHGPADVHDRTFSKRAVIESLRRDSLPGGTGLLSFGDGPVEIRETKAVGGTAVAVASDEHNNGSGIADPRKRSQLLDAGADAVIADFQNPAQILAALIA